MLSAEKPKNQINYNDYYRSPHHEPSINSKNDIYQHKHDKADSKNVSPYKEIPQPSILVIYNKILRILYAIIGFSLLF